MAESSDVLDYLNYNQMMDGTQELLVSDKWDITFDKMPSAVYWPGDTFMKFRVKEVGGLGMSLFQHSPITTEIRGFEVPVQAGQIKFVNATVTFTLLDYEDQSIYVWISDWTFKCCDPVTQKSYRSEELRANLTYSRLNINHQPVRRYVQKFGMIDSPSYDDPMNGDRALVGDGSTVGIKGIVFPPEFMNLSA
jgi:hypothetical protein